MMPQKKNPDVAELVRGRCGRVVGDLVALLVTMKGLPLAYNRDMQEDKPPIYDSLDTWSACLELSARMLRATTFDVARMRRALDDGFVLATELADHLAARGVPFREAHHVVGAIVRHCVSAGTTLEALTLEALRAFHPSFADDACAWLDAERAIERRDVPGGPATSRRGGDFGRARRTGPSDMRSRAKAWCDAFCYSSFALSSRAAGSRGRHGRHVPARW